MSLPWVRLDANIASHDKVLEVIGTRGGKPALVPYMFSLAWSGGHGTDGHIPAAALPMIHGTPKESGLLVAAGLWEPNGNGWNIRNYALRQELTLTTEVKRRAQRLAAIRTNCVRYHGPDCGCWQQADSLG